jgi:aminopeptidase-like protein
VIDAELKHGSLTYGEICIPGALDEEVFLSTYVCHPSMANDNLSGPCVAAYLAQWLQSAPRRYSYRIIFIPETIGAIAYLSQNLDEMKRRVIAGFNISCVGDDRAYSYVASRYGGTLADKAAKNVLAHHAPGYKTYSFLERGSDERQYCAPGVDLPLCGICRSKYGEFPEYHTSKDDMSLISPDGLGGAFVVLQKCLLALEANHKYKSTCLCEPQFGKRGLYPALSRKGQYDEVRAMRDFLAYADGQNDLIDISDLTGVPAEKLDSVANRLMEEKLVVLADAMDFN